ncbi:MAG: GntR family transcriptional regulator [Trebonia sp.]
MLVYGCMHLAGDKGGELSVRVYERLSDEIVSGQLEEGAPLVEATIATRYGTSRTPVREALRRLEQDGLVERGDRGLRVRGRGPEEILEIYEVRILLEAAAARHAAEGGTRLDLIRIGHAVDAGSAVDPADPDAMAAANRAFHKEVWLASHHGTLIDLLTRVNSHVARYPATTLTSPGRWEEALREHADLLRAIASHDGGAAARIAGDHMTTARDIRLRMYGEELSWPAK